MQGILPRESNKIGQNCECGNKAVRVWHNKGRRGKRKSKSPHYTLKCGCCDEKLVVSYSEGSVEIGGIETSPEEWARVLLPILAFSHELAKSIPMRRSGYVRSITNFRQLGSHCVVDNNDIDLRRLQNVLGSAIEKEFRLELPAFVMEFMVKLIVDMNNYNTNLKEEKHFKK